MFNTCVIVYHFNSTLQKYNNYQYAPSFYSKIFIFLTLFSICPSRVPKYYSYLCTQILNLLHYHITIIKL